MLMQIKNIYRYIETKLITQTVAWVKGNGAYFQNRKNRE